MPGLAAAAQLRRPRRRRARIAMPAGSGMMGSARRRSSFSATRGERTKVQRPNFPGRLARHHQRWTDACHRKPQDGSGRTRPPAWSEASFSRLDHDVGAAHRGLEVSECAAHGQVDGAYRPGWEQGLADWRLWNPLLMVFDFRLDISRGRYARDEHSVAGGGLH